jgi:S1-C subfamily serine protease
MKMKLATRGLAHAAVVVAAIIFICGCANQVANQSKSHASNSTASSVENNVKNYKVISLYRNMGNTMVAVQHTLLATISIDLSNNKICWDSNPLQFVSSEAGESVFFDGSWLIQIKGPSYDLWSAVGIGHQVFIPGKPLLWDVARTPKGSYDEFYKDFKQLKLPQNYHGLVATLKYIDGSGIDISYKFVASMQLISDVCLLNNKTARFYRSTLANGSGTIVIDNGDSKLVLWSDGNWLFSNLSDPGNQFGGFDRTLKQTYLDLRKQTEKASPNNLIVTGTGFFITEDGYLISNYHVVKGAAKVRLLTGAGLIDASVVKVDAANDLALLKAVGRFAPLPIAASRTVKLGGTVATVGFPDIGLQGFAPKLAKGEIASLAGAADDPRYFQISLPVQPGNSGGALVDARGNVVGIVAAKLDASAALAATGSLPENVNYAVKSSLLLSFLESVPDVAAKLKEPNTVDGKFEDVVKSAQDAAVLVLVY